MRMLLPLAVAVTACTSETLERDQMGRWASPAPTMAEAQAKRDAPPPPPPPEKPRDPSKEIVVGEETAALMGDFVNRPSTLFADAVDVDLSRNGFLAMATFSISPDAVVRRDSEEGGILTIALTRRPEVHASKETVPTVRFGYGLQIVGVDRVTLRFSPMTTPDRPMWIHAVGAGKKAVYSIESKPPQEWRGGRVDLRGEIAKVGGAYRFTWNAEARP
jgi:hypothetical protein